MGLEQAECKECGAKQAQIDRLMLEYCPDEMTTEQMQEWGNNQRPAEQAKHEPVAWVDLTKEELHQIEMICETSAECYRIIAKALKDRNYAAPMKQAEQEPVVFYRCNGCGHAYESFAPSSCDCIEGTGFSRIEYYAAPLAQQDTHATHVVRTKDLCHPWQDLTDDEIGNLICQNSYMEDNYTHALTFARSVIAADREKNRG